MKGPELLQRHTLALESGMGACFPGERAIFRGHDLHAELKDLDWMELYVFGVTGRRYNEGQLRLLHAIWVCTSYPDARIWNNRVAALAGSARSTGVLGMAAALAVSEASIYGGGIYLPSINFLISTRKAVEQGGNLSDCVREELQRRRGIAGYGRPLTSQDERIAPIMALAERYALSDGPHLRLAFAVNDFLQAGRWRLRINYGAVAAALCADMGFSSQEYYLFMFPAFLAGMPPCYTEHAGRSAGALFPLSCAHIRYEGAPKRPWQCSSD